MRSKFRGGGSSGGIFFLFTMLAGLVHFSEGLECHTCFSFSDDLHDCPEIPIEDLGAKLVKNRVSLGRTSGRALAVPKYDATACIKFDTIFADDQGHPRNAVVRSQIRQKSTNLFATEDLNEECSIRMATTNLSKSEVGVSLNTRFCACTADFCNTAVLVGSKFSVLFFITFFSIFIASRL